MKDIQGNSQLCMNEIVIPATDRQRIIEQDGFSVDKYGDPTDAWRQWFEYLSAKCRCEMFIVHTFKTYKICFDLHDDAVEFKLKYM